MHASAVNFKPIRCLFDNKNERETPILNQQKNVSESDLKLLINIKSKQLLTNLGPFIGKDMRPLCCRYGGELQLLIEHHPITLIQTVCHLLVGLTTVNESTEVLNMSPAKRHL